MNLLHVGDFGLSDDESYNEKVLNELNKTLLEKNILLFVIRGNHDNPKYFTDLNFKASLKYENIYFKDDYTVLNIEEKNFLFIGGATSIDREIRLVEGLMYFPEEAFVYQKLKESDFNGDLDYVITHTCPNFALVSRNEFAGHVIGLKSEIYKEGLDLEQVYYDLLDLNQKPKKWFFGHFHKDRVLEVNDTEFICVGEDKFYNLD